MDYKRGVFILSEKLPSDAGWYIGLGICFNGQLQLWIMGMPVLAPVELAIFNEVMFANWFLVERIKEKTLPDDNERFLISEVANQEQWDSVRQKMNDGGVTTAILNPCNLKDHKCPLQRFNLKDANDFNNLKEWFLKCPNQHIL